MAILRTDEYTEVRDIWQNLALPGLIDIHTHFMPKSVMDKVWQYFDAKGPLIGREWPITYRMDEANRVDVLRRFGVRWFSSLIYPHKPDMAQWLNQWAAQFATSTPDCLHTATFYPEPAASTYVADAIESGVQLFKAHIQVGDYDPNHPLLEDVWGLIAEAGIPVVTHCGSGPQPGTYTGPAPIRALLRRHPRLTLVIAHLGMPEYRDFIDIALHHERVHLDTTMTFTAFAEEMMPVPRDVLDRLPEAGDRILFGSDFPNIPYGYADALRAITQLNSVDDDWLRNVFYRNAVRLLGLTHS